MDDNPIQLSINAGLFFLSITDYGCFRFLKYYLIEFECVNANVEIWIVHDQKQQVLLLLQHIFAIRLKFERLMLS